MVVEDVASQEDERLFRMSKNFHGVWRQVSDTELDEIGRDQKHLAAERGHGELIQGNKAEDVGEGTRNDGPVGGRVQLRG